MRVLLAGDSHRNINYIRQLLQVARLKNCSRIFQLGDFGYWEHIQQGVVFLDAVSEAATEAGIEIDWIDGNHDNHPMLWSMYGQGHKQRAKVRKNLYYYGRGLRWEWEDIRFMSLGGGYSIDKADRTIWKSWWPTELLTEHDLAWSIRSGKVDIMLVHDAPSDINLIGRIPGFQKNLPDSDANRERLQKIINCKEPDLVVHGHMHYRYNDFCREGKTQVVGLAHERIDRSTIILEVDRDHGWSLEVTS